jgi:hypothetical protein
MKDLAQRLAALDPDACAALRVISQFDQLASARAGLPTIVREAAVLAGCPARLVDEKRRLSVRVEADGVARPGKEPAEPNWLAMSLPGEAAARFWLERPGPAGPVEAMVLERASATAAAVLRRTRGAGTRAANNDPACVDLVLDASVPEVDRLWAARQLGLTAGAVARAVAVHEGPPVVEPVPPPVLPPPYQNRRAGVGPVVAVAELPSSWAGARTALRFTASDTPSDPGPRIVAYDELGGLVLLAAAVGPAAEPLPDVRALAALATSTPLALATLVAVAGSSSLRAAAAALRIHHSTLQDRLTPIEHQLGWPVRDPEGRLRLQLALALRRLHQNLG